MRQVDLSNVASSPVQKYHIMSFHFLTVGLPEFLTEGVPGFFDSRCT